MTLGKFFAIGILLAAGWYAYDRYGEYLPEFLRMGGTVHSVEFKCITEDGSVIYGTIPPGTRCARMEPVNGSLTIVPSKIEVSGEKPWYSSFLDFTRSYRSTESFHCDGRTSCSQMTSCAEAKFFLKHCPGVHMDGNNDGVPCKKQWCR